MKKGKLVLGERVKNALVTGTLVALVGAPTVTIGAMYGHQLQQAARTNRRVEQTLATLADQIRRDLTQHGDGAWAQGALDVTAVRFDTQPERAIPVSCRLIIYGRAEQDTRATAFKMVYHTKNRQAFGYPRHHKSFAETNALCDQIRAAELVTVESVDQRYVQIFDDHWGPKDLADVMVPADHAPKEHGYVPLFAEIGSYEKDGQNHGYVVFDGLYTAEQGAADLYENALTCAVPQGLSQSAIFETVMGQVKTQPAAVKVDCLYAGRSDEPSRWTDQLNANLPHHENTK